MAQYEYKTLSLDYDQPTWGKPKAPDLEGVLNTEAKDGWRLRSILPITHGAGYTAKFLVVLERASS